MTKAQERTIEQIKKAIPKFDFYGHPDDYEILKLEEKETREQWQVYSAENTDKFLLAAGAAWNAMCMIQRKRNAERLKDFLNV